MNNIILDNIILDNIILGIIILEIIIPDNIIPDNITLENIIPNSHHSPPHQVELPPYKDEASMRRALLTCIHFGVGGILTS